MHADGQPIDVGQDLLNDYADFQESCAKIGLCVCSTPLQCGVQPFLWTLGIGTPYVWAAGAKLSNNAFGKRGLRGPTIGKTTNQWTLVFNVRFTDSFTNCGIVHSSTSYIAVNFAWSLQPLA